MKQLIHDGAHPLPFACSSSVGKTPVFLSGLGTIGVLRTAYLVPTGSVSWLRKRRTFLMGFPIVRGAEDVQVRWGQVGGIRFTDVVDIDRRTERGRLPFELLCHHRSVAKSRGVIVLDLHHMTPSHGVFKSEFTPPIV